ncbi:hypothetical protein B0I35DRAFT_166199 [Stachybotrys elegans]|uniref:WSC domain-containing protein n=1 Tax=Stachybotrys elegans TaxID=80388 RepID=A0A8K0SY52_9HYPO|nr:hypothetical protein B0I35DRAFT_166199 [Stachybotrys elegans]
MPRLDLVPRSAGLLLIALAASSTALDFDICSSFNTASIGRNNSNLQSNGLCRDFCVDDYAYAITQRFSCWCTNFAPAESVELDDGDCNTPCPGYPLEECGGSNAFGYLELNQVAPSGTRGPDEQTSSTTTSESSTPTSYVETNNGQVTTVIVTTSGGAPTDSSNNGGDSTTDDNDGLGTGAIVGIVVGVIGAVLIAAGLVLFWFLRRRKQNRNEDGFQPDPSVNPVPGSASASTGPTMAMTASTPISATGSGTRRNSSFIDPRMDPFKQGLYARNHSHESLNTIRDDHDYSRKIQNPRVLRATNPDPDAE